MRITPFIVFLTIIGIYSVTASEHWSYWGQNGPAHWPGLCETGKKQSPINIRTEDTIQTNLGSLKFIRYNEAFRGTIKNNGHSVQINLAGAPIHLEGARLSSTYNLEQMHFHWPSEHTIDGSRDALELHLVHYNNQYNNASVAAKYDKGIAVVAVLFELSNKDNPAIVPILKATKLISDSVGKTTELPEPKISPSIFLPKHCKMYYHYEGSLTTPDCQESVLWFILAAKMSISNQQSDIFKHVETDNGTLVFNYRPAQPLGKRKVYKHFYGYSVGSTFSYNFFYMCLILLSFKFL